MNIDQIEKDLKELYETWGGENEDSEKYFIRPTAQLEVLRYVLRLIDEAPDKDYVGEFLKETLSHGKVTK